MTSKFIYTVGGVAGSAVLAWVLKTYSISEKKDFPSSNVQCSSTIISTDQKVGTIKSAIEKSRDIVLRIKDEVGAPGLVIGVSIDGKTVWKEGFGFANVENRSCCHADTVMRIASISKSMTMAMVAKLWEDGNLDLDAPVQKYVPSFPSKTFEGKQVEITTRMLVSHLAGIRHYVKKGEKEEAELSVPKEGEAKKTLSTREKEVFNKEKFEDVETALSLFKQDELMSQPGTKYLYTTHGWTLVSAVLEGAGKQAFSKQAKQLFTKMGLHQTRLDEHEPIIYNRASYYRTSSSGRLVNVPFTDNSYKWAGGGFVSTVGDLLKFAHSMLYSYQWKPGMIVENGKLITQYISNVPEHPKPDLPPGFLKPETINEMWTPVPLTVTNGLNKYRDGGYGMGWQVVPYRAEYGTTGGGDIQNFHTCHSGAAVGASSILLILPSVEENSDVPPPRGVCLAIITNMNNVALRNVANEIAHIFYNVKSDD